MTDRDRRPTDMQAPVIPPATAAGNGGLPFIIAGLLMIVLAVGYFAVGIPVLTASDEARSPDRRIDATIQQPSAVAPVPAPSAQPRP